MTDPVIYDMAASRSNPVKVPAPSRRYLTSALKRLPKICRCSDHAGREVEPHALLSARAVHQIQRWSRGVRREQLGASHVAGAGEAAGQDRNEVIGVQGQPENLGDRLGVGGSDMGHVLQGIVGGDLPPVDGDDHEGGTERRERLQANRARRSDQQGPLHALALSASLQRDIGERAHARELGIALREQGEGSSRIVRDRFSGRRGRARGDQRQLHDEKKTTERLSGQP